MQFLSLKKIKKHKKESIQLIKSHIAKVKHDLFYFFSDSDLTLKD